jgi:3-hydroxyacyl-[acyl-carrier-protein] dehydratase
MLAGARPAVRRGHHEIEALLPHRYPMLLVDAVLDLQPGLSIVASKAVTRDEAAYARARHPGAAEGGQGYPASLVIESFCQAAGILFMESGSQTYDRRRHVLLFGALMGCRISGVALPGDVLMHHARITKALSDSAVFGGEVRVDGRPILTLEHVVMAVRDRGSLGQGAV